jgi:hypothetical protein
VRTAGFVLCCVLLPGIGNAAEDALAHEDDPSSLRIQAGTYSALIARASEAASKMNSVSVDDRENYALHADASIKGAAADLLLLRNQLLMRRLPGGDHKIQWPAWIFEPPTGAISKQTLESRLDWLATQAEAITEPVCQLAATTENDPLICSVE